MNPVSAFVVFAMLWFLALYCLLPVNVRSQEEAGDDIPEGAMPGAPSNPQLKLKMIGATIISFVLTGIIYVLIETRTLSLGVVEGLFAG